MPKDKHFLFMAKALKIAEENLGLTFPNPTVGCVVVKNGKILAESATAIGGRPHAESLALAKLSAKQIKHATVYVTLEPCCHQGVTPPCVDMLIAAKIKRIYIAHIDPDQRVNGKSIEKLKQAGVEVILGVMADEAYRINYGFIKLQTCKLPMVTLKLATSLDGKIALKNGQSKWITNTKAREYSHKLRSQNDAILVGIHTVLLDDPLLNVRLNVNNYHSPIRIVLDKDLSIPLESKLVNSLNLAPLWLITNNKKPNEKSIALEKIGVKILYIDWQKNDYIKNAMSKLATLNISRILVEGGAQTATDFITAKMIDQLIFINSNKIIGHDGLSSINVLPQLSLDHCIEFKLDSFFALDNDLVKIYSALR